MRAESSRRRGQRGFSLLEMLVAIAILGLALGALYQAASSATRNVRTSERYAYGVELARSLLAENSRVPRSGVNASGETSSGYQWRVESRALGKAGDSELPLQDIEVGVAWFDGDKRREIVLNSVVEAYHDAQR
ncbi:prepilin-type N-terminal cleavage/methylation domain-containing protein [Mangrovimicrobium sediminis]|uniref:Prepilin-type N-terminal cleavage/methylation domain-containing protein n=1 Tax=Mangrovimicrobium sediminis TaxID=2562682 RepID=A0A4Z0M3S7_9GAMM|nr:prepilin-type N-terminal cleavage/methylation domain-containing protein [Haliea sp. SAOS-164]TGD74106.1 prepilin-type N-terminal cleavage/methylation domain-containing protein [Haliea sp. SAOS-164]